MVPAVRVVPALMFSELRSAHALSELCSRCELRTFHAFCELRSRHARPAVATILPAVAVMFPGFTVRRLTRPLFTLHAFV